MTETVQNEAQAPAADTQAAPAQPAQEAAVAGSVEVQEPQLPAAVDKPVKAAPGQIDILLDSTMAVSACLGEAQIQIRDLLGLSAGSVVKLTRQVGEPIDLYLRGIRFATGHLVVVGDQLGVRIKDILPPQST